MAGPSAVILGTILSTVIDAGRMLFQPGKMPSIGTLKEYLYLSMLGHGASVFILVSWLTAFIILPYRYFSTNPVTRVRITSIAAVSMGVMAFITNAVTAVIYPEALQGRDLISESVISLLAGAAQGAIFGLLYYSTEKLSGGLPPRRESDSTATPVARQRNIGGWLTFTILLAGSFVLVWMVAEPYFR